jgi:hypothetical protein
MAEPAPLDPAAARKAAEEAEERRLAEIRSHGTPVTPDTFAPWKERFYAELKAAQSRYGSRTSPRYGEYLWWSSGSVQLWLGTMRW